MSFSDSLKDFKNKYISDTIDEPGDKKPDIPVIVTGPTPTNFIKQVKDIDFSVVKKRLIDTINEKAPKSWASLQAQISTLKEVLPDEGSAYKAAIALLVKGGTSFEQLEQDVKTVLDILDGEKQEFDSQAEKQLSQKVGTRQKHVDDIKAQVKSLEDQIAALNTQAGEEITAIALDSNKINEGKQKFAAGYNSLKKDLTDEKTKISAYGAKNV